MALTAVDTLALTSVPDSIGADSVPVSGMQLLYGIILDLPSTPAPENTPPAGGDAMSWVIAAMILVGVVACFRYRKNSRYFSLMLNTVMEVRERSNAFDDTLRETSFLWLLNLLWCGSAGILLFTAFAPTGSDNLAPLGLCIALAGAYTLFLTISYGVVGDVFSDASKASLWVRGYLSTQGLEAVGLFPAALLALCTPSLGPAMIVVGIAVFLIAKVLFIYKSFCIFFTDSAAWVLFLYYLCSLEIVPIVLTYAAAVYLCK